MGAGDPGRSATALAPDLKAAYRALVDERFGLRLSEWQARPLDGVVAELTREGGYGSPAELLGVFQRGERTDLIEELAGRLTIGETHFFRIGPQIEALRRCVLPDVIARRLDERRLRLWSAGCSTGEEPYTLAILLREQLPALSSWEVELLATDVSRPALAAARRGRYREWSFRETPAPVRERYFVAEDGTWRLLDSIRSRVRFEQLNLASGPFPPPGPPGFDVILCRNVTIYFSHEATQRLYRRFADVLASGGWLVLGPSDPGPDASLPLKPVHLDGAILWRRSAGEHAAALDNGAAAGSPTSSLAGLGALTNWPRPGWSTGGRVSVWTPPTEATTRAPNAADKALSGRTGSADQWPPGDAAVARGAGAGSASAAGRPVVTLEHVRALVQGGERAAARRAAAQLAQARPLESEAHLWLGLLDLEGGNAASALESLRRATFLDSRNPLAQFTLGRAYLLTGDRARAQSVLRQARQLLATLADDAVIPGSGDMLVLDLRPAVAALLATE